MVALSILKIHCKSWWFVAMNHVRYPIPIAIHWIKRIFLQSDIFLEFDEVFAFHDWLQRADAIDIFKALTQDQHRIESLVDELLIVLGKT